MYPQCSKSYYLPTVLRFVKKKRINFFELRFARNSRILFIANNFAYSWKYCGTFFGGAFLLISNGPFATLSIAPINLRGYAWAMALSEDECREFFCVLGNSTGYFSDVMTCFFLFINDVKKQCYDLFSSLTKTKF